MVQWVIWYEEFVVKNGLYATANQAHAPKLASFKFYIHQILHPCLSMDSYDILFWFGFRTFPSFRSDAPEAYIAR